MKFGENVESPQASFSEPVQLVEGPVPVRGRIPEGAEAVDDVRIRCAHYETANRNSEHLPVDSAYPIGIAAEAAVCATFYRVRANDGRALLFVGGVVKPGKADIWPGEVVSLTFL